MAGETDGYRVTIAMVVSVTLEPSDVPSPTVGASAMATAMERLLLRRGLTAKVEGVHSIILSKPNPDPEEVFKETLFRVLDGDGEQVPDRQVRVVEHERLSHPFELLLADGRGAPERSFGFSATSYDALLIGETWQKGLLDVRMSDLPLSRGEVAPAI